MQRHIDDLGKARVLDAQDIDGIVDGSHGVPDSNNPRYIDYIVSKSAETGLLDMGEPGARRRGGSLSVIKFTPERKEFSQVFGLQKTDCILMLRDLVFVGANGKLKHLQLVQTIFCRCMRPCENVTGQSERRTGMIY